MRIAIVGSGIAGLASAWWLSQRHEVVLFERESRLGGHTHTHSVVQAGRRYSVDSGFIVFNADNYPLFSRMLDELGVPSQPTTMSFSVQDARSGLEYNATDFDSLFCQRRNLVSPRFWGMLRDLARFYREAPALLEGDDTGPTLGDYLQQGGYGAAFRDEHLVPMASALWSSPPQGILAFPARYLVQFMANHHMLQFAGRAPWRVVSGGSARYVEALRARWQVQERPATPVLSVRREAWGASIRTAAGEERFDAVVMACHSDQALALLADADTREREILGAIRYQSNEVVLHTDASLLPASRKAWAAWNAHVPETPGERCTVSYCMNLLQGLDCPRPLVVTLNRSEAIAPEHVLRRLHYAHPVYDHAMVRAQRRRHEIQGRRHTWFAGAYWGWGFHEDGIRSARELVDAFAAASNGGDTPGTEIGYA